jgi:adenylate cyclase
LGGFELSSLPGGERLTSLGKRERVLLAYLALSQKGNEQRQKLTTLLWGDAADATTLENLRNCLWALRKSLGDSQHRVIGSDGEDIVLDATVFEVDVLSFRRFAARSDRADLEAAAKLYSGALLEGLDIESEEFESWRRTERERCRDQAVDVLNRLMAQLSESGETERAIETGERLLRLEPLHEAAVRRLMRLYVGTDRRPAAIQLYRTLADALRSELNAQPEAETRAVLAEISRGGEEQTHAPAAADTKSLAHASDSSGEPPPQLAAVIRAPRQAKWSKPTWIVAGGLAAAIGLFLLLQFDRSSDSSIAQQQTGVDAAKVAASSAASAVSLAVLPFVNLSGDPNQEFFSDGITEEITTTLAKVPGLRVVGRTSANQFKDEKRDLRAIGQAIAATRLIEGSVRKTGDRLRISVQLINANDGTQLWSETYDRLLTDIFVVQEDIARSIATSLRVPLGLAAGQQLVANRSIDPESYQQYLRARQLVRARTAGAADAVKILEPLVARNPDFAPAWVQLAQAYGATVVRAGYNASAEEFRRITADYNLKRTAAAKRAAELDPNSAEAYWAQAAAQTGSAGLQSTEELLSKAFALDPNNPDVLNAYSNLLLRVGRLKEALRIKQQVVALEPFVPVYTGNLGEALWLNGQNEAALAVLKSGPRGNNRAAELARVYASMGRYSEAADSVLELPAGVYPPELVAEASRLLRMAPTTVVSPETLPRLAALGFIYPYIGAPVRVLEFYEEGYDDIKSLWHSSFAPIRKTERFKAILRNAGLAEYWRARGWPAFCRPVGADDFECE